MDCREVCCSAGGKGVRGYNSLLTGGKYKHSSAGHQALHSAESKRSSALLSKLGFAED